MKKVCLLLSLLLLLSGCSGDPVSSQPTSETTTVPVPTSSVAPTETQWYNPEWVGCEVITPEEGVLILHGNESFQDTIIDGDVYITANAEVSFHHVWVRGNLYVHGKLTDHGRNSAFNTYAYRNHNTMCSAYDGIHGEILAAKDADGEILLGIVTVDALDYAFETWGKVEFTQQPPTEVRQEVDEDDKIGKPRPADPALVTILSEKQTIASKTFSGDVYITADGDVIFVDVTILGNLYVAGKLRLSDIYGFKTNVQGYVYAHDFGVTCEAFDGTHGQITGGPIFCKGYVVANDALDYAFETWGKP